MIKNQKKAYMKNFDLFTPGVDFLNENKIDAFPSSLINKTESRTEDPYDFFL